MEAIEIVKSKQQREKRKERSILMETAAKFDEYPLPDDFVVYPNFCYVCDGKMIMSDIQGTVADLKRDLREHYNMKAEVIYTCDVVGRIKAKAGN